MILQYLSANKCLEKISWKLFLIVGQHDMNILFHFNILIVFDDEEEITENISYNQASY